MATTRVSISADVITLSIVQTLLVQGFTEDQISTASDRCDRTKPGSSAGSSTRNPQTICAPTLQTADSDASRSRVQEVFGAIADNQRAILSNQATVREIVGVVVQDNFNLKDENRKLRDRMLELERVLAEYQRREELRKERLESHVCARWRPPPAVSSNRLPSSCRSCARRSVVCFW